MNAISISILKERAMNTGAAIIGSDDNLTPIDPCRTPVPLKPSAAMLADGARAGGVTVEVAWRIYQAMIRAAS
ncbi:hypothetical protein HL658_10100 [Azospirillum sp. RWY-5-1]|uniref:Uncharacterized protein n=1 Tax=Azospirillum oleiclasticum TaxID=2735135 RepID=A0ABX2TB69_9PROT|nr:hypothetical protein [Azospirillum oleiclasticum]NYZ12904.1 hypothetical protein [Azospirillum oleiclasticum]NYZ20423.1 hypothetical protein [Azospirillum oleiclasticum]